MPLRAYIHDDKPGDPRDPHNSSLPVPLEDIKAFGYEIFTIDGPEYEENARKVARERGFPATDDQVLVWDFINPEQTSSEVKGYLDLLADSGSNESDFKNFSFPFDFLIAVVAGNGYIDFHDPFKKSWIRVELAPGTLIHTAATGGLRRLVPKSTRWIMFLKGTESERKMLWDKEIEEHPTHADYLKRMGL